MVEVIKFPTEEDLKWCKTCTLNTIGKKLGKKSKVEEEWMERIILADHSPLRELWFGIKMEVPYWIAMHYRTHQIAEGVYDLSVRPDFKSDYISTQRDDRVTSDVPRGKKPQDEIVSYIMSINAPALINMAHKRLCKQASEETREVMKEIVEKVVEVAPYMKKALVPLCVYRNGKCDEFFSCKGEK